METLVDKKPFRKLGFNNIETTEIVGKINEMIANYQVFYHKVQNFHWNVVGSDFYDIHEITEGLYQDSQKNIDILAERVRVFGKTPIYKMRDILNLAELKEDTHNMSGEYMIRNVIEDIETLISLLVEIHEVSTMKGDLGTKSLVERMVSSFETTHWQLSSFVSQKYEA